MVKIIWRDAGPDDPMYKEGDRRYSQHWARPFQKSQQDTTNETARPAADHCSPACGGAVEETLAFYALWNMPEVTSAFLVYVGTLDDQFHETHPIGCHHSSLVNLACRSYFLMIRSWSAYDSNHGSARLGMYLSIFDKYCFVALRRYHRQGGRTCYYQTLRLVIFGGYL